MTVAVIGYGNQGRSQALNLKDSGANVIVGNIDDEFAVQAKNDGMNVVSIADAVKNADATMILLPDEITPDVFERWIRPNLKAGSALCFASGYNITYRHVECPGGIDLILLAPRMIGTGVRSLFLSKEGFYSFVAVEQNATGKALDVLLALSHGVGTLLKGAVEVTYKIETELDLFNEQGFGPAFGRVLLSAIDTMVSAGYPKEAVFLEFYLSGEFGYIMREMAETGLFAQLDHHSQTSQYGAMSRGVKFLWMNVKKPMKKILKVIQSGKFAREWTFEKKTGKLRYRFLKAMAKRQPIIKTEAIVRQELGI